MKLIKILSNQNRPKYLLWAWHPKYLLWSWHVNNVTWAFTFNGLLTKNPYKTHHHPHPHPPADG